MSIPEEYDLTCCQLIGEYLADFAVTGNLASYQAARSLAVISEQLPYLVDLIKKHNLSGAINEAFGAFYCEIFPEIPQ